MLKIKKLTVGGVTYELAGEKGDPGEKGDKGDKGEKGDKGDPGAGLETVLPLIPEAASPKNPLADKAYVDDAVPKNKTYVRKNNITVSEDVAQLILTEDDHGNAYNYDDVYVIWRLPKADITGARATLTAQQAANYLCDHNGLSLSISGYQIAARGYISGGRFFGYSVAAADQGTKASPLSTPQGTGIYAVDKIKTLRFTGTNSLLAGTTIQVYALEG